MGAPPAQTNTTFFHLVFPTQLTEIIQRSSERVCACLCLYVCGSSVSCLARAALLVHCERFLPLDPSPPLTHNHIHVTCTLCSICNLARSCTAESLHLCIFLCAVLGPFSSLGSTDTPAPVHATTSTPRGSCTDTPAPVHVPTSSTPRGCCSRHMHVRTVNAPAARYVDVVVACGGLGAVGGRQRKKGSERRVSLSERLESGEVGGIWRIPSLLLPFPPPFSLTPRPPRSLSDISFGLRSFSCSCPLLSSVSKTGHDMSFTCSRTLKEKCPSVFSLVLAWATTEASHEVGSCSA